MQHHKPQQDDAGIIQNIGEHRGEERREQPSQLADDGEEEHWPQPQDVCLVDIGELTSHIVQVALHLHIAHDDHYPRIAPQEGGIGQNDSPRRPEGIGAGKQRKGSLVFLSSGAAVRSGICRRNFRRQTLPPFCCGCAYIPR